MDFFSKKKGEGRRLIRGVRDVGFEFGGEG